MSLLLVIRKYKIFVPLLCTYQIGKYKKTDSTELRRRVWSRSSHTLLEFTQTHVHQVSDAIQPSHPLSSPSPAAPNPS